MLCHLTCTHHIHCGTGTCPFLRFSESEGKLHRFVGRYIIWFWIECFLIKFQFYVFLLIFCSLTFSKLKNIFSTLNLKVLRDKLLYYSSLPLVSRTGLSHVLNIFLNTCKHQIMNKARWTYIAICLLSILKITHIHGSQWYWPSNWHSKHQGIFVNGIEP